MTSVLAPGHAVDTFPEIMRRVVDAGHEVGYHGYYHENPTKISRETEKKLIQLGLNAFRNQLGVRPLGTALRIWEYSEPTLDLVEEFGFKYDSSLMGRDLQAYHPQRWQINWEKGNVAGWPVGSSKSLFAGTSMTFRCSPFRTPSAASRTPARS